MEEELRRCQIHEWYPNFKPYTIQTISSHSPTPLSATSLENQFLPLMTMVTRMMMPPQLRHPSSSQNPSPAVIPSPATMAPTSTLSPPYPSSIPSLTMINAVFPKLNWSAPKDAAWISTNGTLCCTSFAEIALLLKSSDSVAHDLSHSALSSFVLALRKFYPSLRPEMEFRCFVRHKQLVAISQREVTSFYPILLDQRHEMQPLIAEFFYKVVKPRFASEDYTFDVYVTGDGKVKVLDFNPWGEFTLPLLFGWEELEGEGFGEEAVDFRIVESRLGVRPGLKTAVPYDYLDTGEGSGWDQFLKRADEELRRQQQVQTPGADA